MDFKPFEGKSDDGAEMVVLHPGTGNVTDAVIVLAGEDSQVWRSASHKLSARLMRESGPRRDPTRVVYEREENTAELLASVTLQWKNVSVNGKALSCTLENARKLYIDYPWLAEQVNGFIGNRANFFRAVAASPVEGDKGQDDAAAAPEG